MSPRSTPGPGVTPRTALTIAGSDSGGGAGVQADLKTFLACGVHGMSAITAVTVQNSLGVSGFHEIPAETVRDQVRVVTTDIGANAVKTGMLASAGIIEAVAGTCDELGIGRAAEIPLVVDPVAASMHGDSLLADSALGAVREVLLPRATLTTPNLDEVRLLTGVEVTRRADLRKAAEAVLALGPRWVLIKAGHLAADSDCVDLLVGAGGEVIELPGPRHPTEHTHGGGDTLAAAVTAALAQGRDLVDAVRVGKRYIMRAVAAAYPLGGGVGPVSAFWRVSDVPW
ncbi:bifunctional hydroxymethylpyrimidine kinase/phosphomethylpyrimidine kinase [Actinoalloteichus sp. AHMU CJ021]|uniref:Hydroxymethylpyrimidine/phosphomethylpyrimidine kinase n=1 Tax=Actinoalloteichus caeruleus DSM 43889 TaxID=1120930 RepID=A0ABT1JKA4_ACTCY|nr:bifunctional hydroxymethylpyrimidine kinase/phosphomethylpyrimidine kinase [Actinoalloteichus caeruleus]AUS78503.1 bifunctional hydroxymethylpyrimidine kinase/phosphomethylpyrimidine kinase [Actinoalloteichus sp. AHMU CJ021]MCP2332608.1 hydroxymethylpyrimidine/phosphomethylpyrimidine kinase [Actinoalloteichus caeruleus DSM 43889]